MFLRKKRTIERYTKSRKVERHRRESEGATRRRYSYINPGEINRKNVLLRELVERERYSR